MLQSIRDKAHGWVAWVIFSFIALTFAMWGAHNYFQDSEAKRVAAKVNGTTIKASEVRRVTDMLKTRQEAQFGSEILSNPMFDKILKQQALQMLVQSAVLINKAHKDGFSLEKDQILLALRDIPAFQVDGEFSQERFDYALRSSHLTGDQFFNEVQTEMLIGQLSEQFANSHFVLDNDIETIASLINQQRAIDYVLLKPDLFEAKISVKDDELEAYYLENIAQFQIPEAVSVEYITLEMKDLLGRITLSDEEVNKYYQTHLSQFTTPAEWKVSYIQKVVTDESPESIEKLKGELAKLKQQAESGSDFAELAKTHSDDVMTSKKGGSMGWIKAGTLDDSFEQVVFTLGKPGQLSDPVRTQYGLVLIKLDDIKAAKTEPLSNVKDNVRKLLQAEKTERVFAEAAETFANLSFEQPDSLEPVADALDLKVQTSDYFDKNGAKEGMGQYPAVVRAAFSEDVLIGGNNSEVLQVTPEMLAVIRLKSQRKASHKPLEEVKDIIKKQLTREKALTKAQTEGANIAAQLEQSKAEAADKSLSALNLSWQATTMSRNPEDAKPSETNAFLEKVFAMPASNLADKAETKGFLLPNGYVIVKLKSISQKSLDADASKKQRDVIKQLLSQRYTYLVKDIYTQALVKNAKVEIAEQ